MGCPEAPILTGYVVATNSGFVYLEWVQPACNSPLMYFTGRNWLTTSPMPLEITTREIKGIGGTAVQAPSQYTIESGPSATGPFTAVQTLTGTLRVFELYVGWNLTKYFRIIATNNDGQSPPSNVFRATFDGQLPPIPTPNTPYQTSHSIAVDVPSPFFTTLELSIEVSEDGLTYAAPTLHYPAGSSIFRFIDGNTPLLPGQFRWYRLKYANQYGISNTVTHVGQTVAPVSGVVQALPPVPTLALDNPIVGGHAIIQLVNYPAIAQQAGFIYLGHSVLIDGPNWGSVRRLNPMPDARSYFQEESTDSGAHIKYYIQALCLHETTNLQYWSNLSSMLMLQNSTTAPPYTNYFFF